MVTLPLQIADMTLQGPNFHTCDSSSALATASTQMFTEWLETYWFL